MVETSPLISLNNRQVTFFWVLFCFVLGLHLTVLRDFSWQTQEILWDAKDLTCVLQEQGKCPT